MKACAALLVPNLFPSTIFTTPFVQFSAASAQVVGDVLGKLLIVGITDPGGFTWPPNRLYGSWPPNRLGSKAPGHPTG